MNRRDFLTGTGSAVTGMTILAGCSAESENPSNGSQRSTTASPTPTSRAACDEYLYCENGVGIYGTNLYATQHGNLGATGTAVNLTEGGIGYLSVKVAFLDSSGNRLDANIDNRTNLSAGYKWNWEALANPSVDAEKVEDAEVVSISTG